MVGWAQTPEGTRVHNINLTEARDIAAAGAVNAAISLMVKDVMSCNAPEKKNPQACVCSFKDDLNKLKAAYDRALAKHPGWNEPNTVVTYFDPVTGKSVALAFPNIKRQLDACEKR